MLGSAEFGCRMDYAQESENDTCDEKDGTEDVHVCEVLFVKC